tara:strand:- start:12 stop:209 length:198 start_codon:yes stop_codon:yes gene_type:complete
MIYLIVALSIANTFLIIYFFNKQKKVNEKIIDALNADTKNKEEVSDKNKKHIDDMLKMREMYESD